MISEKLLNGDSPLYDSKRDENILIPGEVTFNPVEKIDYTIKPAPVTIQAPRTILPQSVDIVPDVMGAPENPVIIINETKMSKLFDIDTGESIISDIKNDVPLKPDIAEILIKNDVVKEANPAEKTGTKKQINLSSNPANKMGYAGEDTPKVILKKDKTSISIIDKLTDFLYKLIYV